MRENSRGKRSQKHRGGKPTRKGIGRKEKREERKEKKRGKEEEKRGGEEI